MFFAEPQLMKFILVFWDLGPCSHIEADRRFIHAYCLHHQGDESFHKTRNLILAVMWTSNLTSHINFCMVAHVNTNVSSPCLGLMTTFLLYYNVLNHCWCIHQNSPAFFFLHIHTVAKRNTTNFRRKSPWIIVDLFMVSPKILRRQYGGYLLSPLRRRLIFSSYRIGDSDHSLYMLPWNFLVTKVPI
jgi:hypothetical protein